VAAVQDTLLTDEGQIREQLRLAEDLFNSDIRQSLIHARQALDDANAIHSELLIAESEIMVGKCFDYLGANIEALENLKHALAIYDSLDMVSQKAYALRLIGNIYYYAGEHSLALEYYYEVHRNSIALNDTSLMIHAMIGMGSVNGNTSKYDSAILLFQDALRLSRAIGDKATEVQCLFFIGDVYIELKKPESALAIFNEVEKGYDLEKINSKYLSSLYNSKTFAYILERNADSARFYNTKTSETLRKYPRSAIQTYCLLNKFRIDTLERDYLSAIKSYMSYNRLSDSINMESLKYQLANFEIVYELEKKEREIDRLTHENILKDLSIKQKKIINYGSGAIVIMLFIVVFLIFRSERKIRLKNIELQGQREELAATNDELSATNEDLCQQREKLESALDRLNKAQEQLIQAEKMASLGIMAAGVAHEINNPLNFIQGSIEGVEDFLRDNCEEKEGEIKPLLDGMKEGVRRADAIVTSLNSYSRRDDCMSSNCNIHSILDNCLVIINNLIRNRIEVKKDYSEIPFTIKGNEGRLHQAFLNILVNACHAITGNGEISIKTIVGNNVFSIIISDTGCGISEDHLPKILDPFFTTKNPGQGTGLGLSITYNIIKEHKGLIKFKSEIGQGTDVTVSIPLNKI